MKSLATVLFCLCALLFLGCGKEEVISQTKAPEKIQPKKEAKKTGPPKTKPQPIFDPNDKNYVAIEAAVRKQLDKPEGELTEADFQKVVELDLSWDFDPKNPKLTDISYLVAFTQLEKLGIYDNKKLDDIRLLAGLTNLRQLQAQNNNITDVSVLLGLTKLNELQIQRNKISKADISKLREALQGCKIEADRF